MKEPRSIIDDYPLSGLQITVIAFCICLNALDGFDVLSISFASPGIAAEWGVERAALGVVLAMELIGMAVGSIVLGAVTDRIGRRPMVLICLVVMSSGMLLASTAQSVEVLSAYRFYTGLGIGGMLAATNALVAEYSNRKRRSLAVVLMATGYPLGAIVGGSISAQLLAVYDWRAVFVFGGVATAVFLPLVWLFVPETIDFLAQRRKVGALETINRTLARMKRASLAALPAVQSGESRAAGWTALFSRDLAPTTVLLTAAYFAHIMTFYFILKWVPKIVVDMGFAASSAAGVLVWANVGGALGSVLLGLLSQRVPVRSLVIGGLLLASLAVVYFGRGQADLMQLSAVAALVGFFTNSVVVGLYAIVAASFPTPLRAGGTGFVIGVGRGGSALGPVVAGLLFAAGHGLQAVSVAMAAGSLVAAIALSVLFVLRRRDGGRTPEAAPNDVQRSSADA
jgi:benzoate transport